MPDIVQLFIFFLVIVLFIFFIAFIKVPSFYFVLVKRLKRKMFFRFKLIAFCGLLISIIFSLIVALNYADNYQLEKSLYENLNVIDGVIYTSNLRELDLNERANLVEFFSNNKKLIEKVLPVYINIDFVGDIRVVILSFDENGFLSFTDDKDFYTVYKELEPDQVIISRSLANYLSISQDSKLDINLLNKNSSFIVKQIWDDNGIVGFDLFATKGIKPYYGSIIVHRSFFEQSLNKLPINSFCVSYKNFDFLGIEDVFKINQELKKITSDLNFWDSKKDLHLNFAGYETAFFVFTRSQLLLLLLSIPLIILILLIVFLASQIYIKDKNLVIELNKFRRYGFSDFWIIFLLFSEVFIYSLVLSVLGFLLSWVFVNVSPIFINKLDFLFRAPIFSYESVLLSVLLSSFLISLCVLLGLIIGSSFFLYFDASKNRFIHTNVKDLTSSIVNWLFSVFVLIVLAFYIWGDFIQDEFVKNFMITCFVYSTFVLLLYFLFYIKKINKITFNILLGLLSLLFSLSFLILPWFNPWKKEYDYLIIFPISVGLIGIAILSFLLFGFITRFIKYKRGLISILFKSYYYKAWWFICLTVSYVIILIILGVLYNALFMSSLIGAGRVVRKLDKFDMLLHMQYGYNGLIEHSLDYYVNEQKIEYVTFIYTKAKFKVAENSFVRNLGFDQTLNKNYIDFIDKNSERLFDEGKGVVLSYRLLDLFKKSPHNVNVYSEFLSINLLSGYVVDLNVVGYTNYDSNVDFFVSKNFIDSWKQNLSIFDYLILIKIVDKESNMITNALEQIIVDSFNNKVGTAVYSRNVSGSFFDSLPLLRFLFTFYVLLAHIVFLVLFVKNYENLINEFIKAESMFNAFLNKFVRIGNMLVFALVILVMMLYVYAYASVKNIFVYDISLRDSIYNMFSGPFFINGLVLLSLTLIMAFMLADFIIKRLAILNKSKEN